MWFAGLMSGTSLDGVDGALVETDGTSILSLGPGYERPYTRAERAVLQTATDDALEWRFKGPHPSSFRAAERVLNRTHCEVVRQLCELSGMIPAELAGVGFHGQTVVHEAPDGQHRGQTCQIGDGQDLARDLETTVVYDFRSDDMAKGGQGAPLAPVYHKALVEMSGLETPIGILNLGGVANITCVQSDGMLTAFDTGPANGLIDAFMDMKTGNPMDANGEIAAKGHVHEAAFRDYLANQYFDRGGPKSLDRWDFTLDPVRNLSVEDGAATLTALTAKTVALSLSHLPESPQRLILCGGGRKNHTMKTLIQTATGLDVLVAEDVGWRGDLLEAEAFAYLAARRLADLPISFPGTTGIKTPMTGGTIVRPV